MSDQKIIWVTGASQGIGEATAIKLAAEGHTVAISARSEDKLKEIASSHESIHAYPLDITDEDACKTVTSAIEKDLGPIDIALLNAGSYKPETLGSFDPETFKWQMDLNVNGTVNCFAPLLPKFIERKSGHIAIVSSVAGYRGLPKSLGYGTSKAALIHLADAMAIMGRHHGLKVQVINPGFVKTPLTDKNDFPMPFLMEVDEAADRIVKGLKSNRFEITFPRRFAYMLKTIGLLPDRLYQAMVGKATAK